MVEHAAPHLCCSRAGGCAIAITALRNSLLISLAYPPCDHRSQCIMHSSGAVAGAAAAMPAVLIGLCVPLVACQVLLVFVQDVAFKQSVVVCAALLFISLGLHGLAHRAGHNQVRRQEHTGGVVGSDCWVHCLCDSGGGIDDG
jgi:hypothetical protein